MDSSCREKAISDIYANLPDETPPTQSKTEDLIEAAENLISAIDNHYRVADFVAPRSNGIRGVRQLAKADVRYLMRERGRPGYRFQMADETLAYLARVFAWDPTREEDNQSFKRFIEYLKSHGFKLDTTSERAALDSLDSMGLLEQESDSGDSVNVRTY